jgi:hypothetical protein
MALGSSEMFVPIYQTIRRQIIRDCNLTFDSHLTKFLLTKEIQLINDCRSAYSICNVCVLLQVDTQCCVVPEVCVNDIQGHHRHLL